LTPLETTERIRAFLEANLAIYEKDFQLQDDDNIFKLGFVDSSFAMQLVVFIEENFEVTITDADLEIANFSSISRMRRLVEEKRKGR
jgi:acyl carrier protein